MHFTKRFWDWLQNNFCSKIMLSYTVKQILWHFFNSFRLWIHPPSPRHFCFYAKAGFSDGNYFEMNLCVILCLMKYLDCCESTLHTSTLLFLCKRCRRMDGKYFEIHLITHFSENYFFIKVPLYLEPVQHFMMQFYCKHQRTEETKFSFIFL